MMRSRRTSLGVGALYFARSDALADCGASLPIHCLTQVLWRYLWATFDMFLAPFLVIPQPSLNNAGSEWGILHAWESPSAFCQLLSCNGHYIK
jgi:hypothetical protein